MDQACVRHHTVLGPSLRLFWVFITLIFHTCLAESSFAMKLALIEALILAIIVPGAMACPASPTCVPRG